MVWDRTASIFMTRLYETGLHPFFDKMVWDRTASIFKTRWRETGLHSFFMARLYETGLHPFLWQDGMRQDCVHFYDKIVWGRTASILHRYVYTHIYTYLCTYIYFSEGMFTYFFSDSDSDKNSISAGDLWFRSRYKQQLHGFSPKFQGSKIHAFLQ